MKIDILTLFPGMFRGPFEESMIRIARRQGCVDLRIIDLRDFADEPHRKVDDRPFGGGPGMVISPAPVTRAIESITDAAPPEQRPRLLMTSPQGERYTQDRAWRLSRDEHIVILCGHYEGFDQRLHDSFPFEEISVGDYVLTGGELPAMVMVDSIVRLIPGVVGDPESIEQESFEDGLLDYPTYTRPREFRGRRVPDVLLSGNHREINAWRRNQSIQRTADRTRGADATSSDS